MRAIMAGKMGNGKVAATVEQSMAMVGANHGNSWGGSKGEGRPKGKDDQKENTKDWKDNKGGQGEAPHCQRGVERTCHSWTNPLLPKDQQNEQSHLDKHSIMEKQLPPCQ